MPHRSENLFSHTFPQAIWRILPHPSHESGVWAVELRNADQKSVSWALLDTDAPERGWVATPEATDWWTTLVAVTDHHLYLHNYRYPDIPEPTDLLAVSAADGTLHWALPGWIYVREEAEYGAIVVARQLPESVEYRMCDPNQGSIGALATGESVPLSQVLREPVRYKPQDMYFDVLSSFLGKTVDAHDAIAIDYLEANPFLVISYYIYIHDKVAQYLLIVNRNKEIIYHEQHGEARPGLGRNTMVWKAGRLVGLRHSNELISLKLTP